MAILVYWFFEYYLRHVGIKWIRILLRCVIKYKLKHFINSLIHRAFPTSIAIDIWLPSSAKMFCIVCIVKPITHYHFLCYYVTENFTKRYNKSIFHLIWHLFNYSFRFLRKKIGFYIVYCLELLSLDFTCILSFSLYYTNKRTSLSIIVFIMIKTMPWFQGFVAIWILKSFETLTSM